MTKSLVLLVVLAIGYTISAQTLSDYLTNRDTVQVMKMLKAGADINQVDERGLTPLMDVCHNGNIEMAAFLLRHGTKIDEPTTPNGSTALMMACSFDYPDDVKLCKLLLDNHANVNAVNTLGLTPLILAGKFGKFEVIKLLLDNGADANKKDNQGLTASDYVKMVDEFDAMGKPIKDAKAKKEAAITLLKSKMK